MKSLPMIVLSQWIHLIISLQKMKKKHNQYLLMNDNNNLKGNHKKYQYCHISPRRKKRIARLSVSPYRQWILCILCIAVVSSVSPLYPLDCDRIRDPLFPPCISRNSKMRPHLPRVDMSGTTLPISTCGRFARIFKFRDM